MIKQDYAKFEDKISVKQVNSRKIDLPDLVFVLSLTVGLSLIFLSQIGVFE